MPDRPNKGEATNIRVYEDTKKDFEACGRYGDTADTILRKLIDFYKAHGGKYNGRRNGDKK